MGNRPTTYVLSWHQTCILAIDDRCVHFLGKRQSRFDDEIRGTEQSGILLKLVLSMGFPFGF
jgi:hypothetical protein